MWLAMWAFARVHLGLSKAEFLGLNMAQWVALRKEHRAKLKQRDGMLELMVAQLVVKVHNTSLAGNGDPMQLREAMPSFWKEMREQEEAAKTQIGESGLPLACEQFTTIMRMLGGKTEPDPIPAQPEKI